MNDLDRYEYEQEKAQEARDGMISEEYNNICGDVGLVEEVIEKYKSDLANVFIVNRSKHISFLGKVAKELDNCILLEAEGNVDNELSGR